MVVTGTWPRTPSSEATSPSTSPCQGNPFGNVTLQFWGLVRQRHPGADRRVCSTSPSQVSELLVPPSTRPSRSLLRGASSEGDPVGRLVPRLTFRLPLLALAALAPLTASSGGGCRLSAADVGRAGLSAPPDISRVS
jgi:hypothetical protein